MWVRLTVGEAEPQSGARQLGLCMTAKTKLRATLFYNNRVDASPYRSTDKRMPPRVLDRPPRRSLRPLFERPSYNTAVRWTARTSNPYEATGVSCNVLDIARGSRRMYSMQYSVYGEFEIPRQGSTIDRKRLSGFWDEVEDSGLGLSAAVGCYLFAIRAAKGKRPWYVGRSNGGFRNECFQHQKLTHYHEVLSDIGKGTAVMVFVARLTPTGRFSRKVPERELDFVERYLIHLALTRNRKLSNVANTKFFSTLSIPGVLNSSQGGLSQGAKALRSTLFAP